MITAFTLWPIKIAYYIISVLIIDVDLICRLLASEIDDNISGKRSQL